MVSVKLILFLVIEKFTLSPPSFKFIFNIHENFQLYFLNTDLQLYRIKKCFEIIFRNIFLFIQVGEYISKRIYTFGISDEFVILLDHGRVFFISEN